MSTGKWRVRRGAGDNLWDVYDPQGRYVRCYVKWQDAMDYADEQARTHKITLPRAKFPMKIGKKRLDLTDPNTITVINKRGELVTGFHRNDWPYLATALLALTAGDTA
ncbi:hypothetical protein [Corynebacterium riegelii]|uniref:hypothetical protein n=1 Tax=Corynebacterium riegelii TaxID=156976 RepID=UPI00288B6889|nr:hypothetical protein [Corynebacterium riegelii]